MSFGTLTNTAKEEIYTYGIIQYRHLIYGLSLQLGVLPETINHELGLLI